MMAESEGAGSDDVDCIGDYVCSPCPHLASGRLLSAYPAGEGLIGEAVELAELRSAQAAGIVGRQQGGALVGGEAEPAALVSFDNGMVRVSHSASDYDRDEPAATKIIRRHGPRLLWFGLTLVPNHHNHNLAPGPIFGVHLKVPR